MKLLPLVWAGLWRKPARTVLTVLAIGVAFLLFGALQGINAGFESAIRAQRLDRLFIDPRVFGSALPQRYIDEIRQVPGIAHITEVSFLGGYFGERTNFGFAIHTNPDQWLAIRPEWQYSKEALAEVLRTRTGVMMSDGLANHLGLKVGDQFTMNTGFPRKGGGTDWEYMVLGIMTGPNSTEARNFLANFSYYDEARTVGLGTVNRFLMRISDPARSTQISKQIDALFATSDAPTRTISEQALAEAAVSDLGDVEFFTRSIMAAVFFALLLLTSNTMMESVRERTAEIGVLKTLGFSESRIFGLVFAEALTMFTLGATIGLLVAQAVFPYFKDSVQLSRFGGGESIPLPAIAFAAAVALGAAFCSVAIPAWRAHRLDVVEALAVR